MTDIGNGDSENVPRSIREFFRPASAVSRAVRSAVRPAERCAAHRRPMPTAIPASSHARLLLLRLQAEWDRLSTSSAAVTTASSWRILERPLASLDELLRSAGYGVVTEGGHGDDRVLGRLIALARTEPLAARIVLQRLLPGISAISRRHGRRCGDLAGAFDDALATAWTVTREYPCDQRPRYIAANLLREIEYRTFRKDLRRKATFVPMSNPVFDLIPRDETSRHAADELRELLDDARDAGFDSADVDLVARLAAGDTPEQLAEEQKVTPRTIRNHRAIVVHRLRQLALAS